MAADADCGRVDAAPRCPSFCRGTAVPGWLFTPAVAARLRGPTLDFSPRDTYAAHVVYSQFRTLISLLIILCVTGIFLYGGSRVLHAVTGAAAPEPTATLIPLIEQPPTASPTPRTHRTATPTPGPTDTPQPSPTPKGPPKVFLTDGNSGSAPSSTFKVGLYRSYCWVRNSALPPNTTSVTISWYRQPNTFLFQYAIQPSGGEASAAFFYASSLPAGKYRCDAVVNGQVVGSAEFSLVQ